MQLNLDIHNPQWKHRIVVEDNDDKYRKAYYQNRGFYGFFNKDTGTMLFSAAIFVIVLILIVALGIGFKNVPGLERPIPDDDEEGGDGLDLGGVVGKLVNDKDKKLLPCPAGQDLVEGNCIRKFLYPSPLDFSMMDNTTSPCVDFYDYACGTYADDIRNIGQDATFSYLYADNTRTVYDAITNTGNDTQLGRFYRTCIRDEAKPFNVDSYEIIPQLLDIAKSVETDGKSIEEAMAYLMQWDIDIPFDFSLELNPLDTRHATPMFIRSGLSEQREYIGTEHHFAFIQRRLQYVVNRFKWNPTTVQLKAKLIVEVEKALSHGWPSEEEESQDLGNYINAMKANHQDLLSYDDFVKLLFPFNIGAFLHYFDEDYFPIINVPFKTSQKIWVFKETYFRQFGRVVSQLSREHWSAYLIHSVLFSVIDPIPQHNPELYYIYHHGYDPEHALPWKRKNRFSTHDSLSTDKIQRCVQITASFLPVILDEYFVDETYPLGMGNVKRQVKQMMQSIKEELSYVLPKKAAQKVFSINVMAGTPDNWPIDRNELQIKEDSYVDNILRIRKFHQKLVLQTMCTSCMNENAPKDIMPEVLFDYPLYYVNAYYQHQLNTIVINAGILKPPVFSPHYNELGQMARLGVILGHETGHSVDMTGSMFDDTGSFFTWLSQENELTYEKNSQCFIDLYSKRTKYGNLHNGELTLNENIADIVGFRTAFNVMFRNTDPENENIKQQKREFFLIYAQTWCQAITPEQELQFIEQSVHSTSRMRVNRVVSQVKDFYDVFQCKDIPNQTCDIFSSLLSRKRKSIL